MGKLINTIINNFSGGLLEDKRSGWLGSISSGFTTRYFGLTKHFDIFSYPKKLVPYRGNVSDDSGNVKTYDIERFLFCPTSYGTGEALHGYGVDAGTTNPKVWLYDDISSGLFNGFTIAKNNAVGAGTNRRTDVFFYYKDYIYLFTGYRYLCRYHSNGSDAFNDSYFDYTTTYSSVVQPVHHRADDRAYFFIDNKVYRLNDTTWEGVVLTLPDNLEISACCEYGNYLAIGCTSKLSLRKKSTVYLWDRDSSLETVSQRIDFGSGELKHLANLNNKLVGVVDYLLDNFYGLNNGKLIIKIASGNFSLPLKELNSDATFANVVSKDNVVEDNKLYIPLKATLNGDTRLGIWVIDEFGTMTIDTLEDSAISYQGIYKIGKMWLFAHSGDGSIDRTSISGYTDTSIYETLVFNAGDSSLSKKLIGVTVTTEKLPAAGQIVLKYRINGATSWTTIFTNTEDDSIEHSAINIESLGANLPVYKEIEFQVLSTGGAVFTGLYFQSEIIDEKLW